MSHACARCGGAVTSNRSDVCQWCARKAVMKTTVFKEFRFEAAHWLPHVPPGHKCARMHGHSYLVRVEITGELDGSGMIIDYDIIKTVFNATVFDVLDHRVLNEVPGLENSTSEILAAWIFGALDGHFDGLRAVEVRETHTAGARVERA